MSSFSVQGADFSLQNETAVENVITEVINWKALSILAAKDQFQ